MSPPPRKRLVTAALAPEDVAFLESLPGARSENVRRAVSTGVAALKGESLTPAALQELRQLTERLEAITRRTPSGCWYAASPEAMPDPYSLAAHDVVVMPHGLLVVAPQSVLTIDVAEGRLILQGAGHGPLSLEVEPRELIHLAADFLPAVLEQAEVAGPCHLPLGLVLQRGIDDRIHLQVVEGVGIALPLDQALAVAAELSSLAVRSVDQTCQRREALEAALAEVTP